MHRIVETLERKRTVALYIEYWKHWRKRELWRYTSNTGKTGEKEKYGVIHRILETLDKKRSVALYIEYWKHWIEREVWRYISNTGNIG